MKLSSTYCSKHLTKEESGERPPTSNIPWTQIGLSFPSFA